MDKDLTYHLFYFGVRDWYDADAERRRSRPAGLRGFQNLQACDTDGWCRTFHHRAAFRGSGRFDIVLDEGARVEIAVTDARSDEPIAGARVAQRPDRGTRPLVRARRGSGSTRR